MKENKLKRFLNKKRCYTLIVVMILLALSYIGLFKVGVEYLLNKGNSEYVFFDELVAKVYDIVYLWILGLLFIVIAIIIDTMSYQTRKFSLSKVDFINGKEIYRELLKEYSTMSLAYVDDFKEDVDKYAVITLLGLELKNKIKIKDTGIEIIDNSIEELRESEQYVLLNIRNGWLEIRNLKEFTSLAKKEAIQRGLVEKNPAARRAPTGTTGELIIKGIKKALFYFISIVVIVLVVIAIAEMDMGPFEDTFSLIGYIILMPVTMAFLCLNYIAYHINTHKTSFRTELGEMVNVKLEGLKNYIKGYSLLKEKEKEQLKLWDEYLIYSVMFNENTKVLYDVSRYVVFK